MINLYLGTVLWQAIRDTFNPSLLFVILKVKSISNQLLIAMTEVTGQPLHLSIQ